MGLIAIFVWVGKKYTVKIFDKITKVTERKGPSATDTVVNFTKGASGYIC